MKWNMIICLNFFKITSQTDFWNRIHTIFICLSFCRIVPSNIVGVSDTEHWVICSSSEGTGEVLRLEHLLWSSHQQPDTTTLVQVSPSLQIQGCRGSNGQRSTLDLKVSYVRWLGGCEGLEWYSKLTIMTIHLRRINDHRVFRLRVHSVYTFINITNFNTSVKMELK